jgi:hypothetical protein
LSGFDALLFINVSLETILVSFFGNYLSSGIFVLMMSSLVGFQLRSGKRKRETPIGDAVSEGNGFDGESRQVEILAAAKALKRITWLGPMGYVRARADAKCR